MGEKVKEGSEGEERRKKKKCMGQRRERVPFEGHCAQTV